MSKKDTIQHILTVFQTSGGEIYGAEAVTQLEHALQAASLARDSGASVVLVAAALLHDIGHLLDDEVPGDAHTSNPEKFDDAHEALRARSKRSGSATRARKTISAFGKASVPRSIVSKVATELPRSGRNDDRGGDRRL